MWWGKGFVMPAVCNLTHRKFEIVLIVHHSVDLFRLPIFFPPGATQPIVGVYFTALYRTIASSRRRLLDHTQGRATIGRNILNE